MAETKCGEQKALYPLAPSLWWTPECGFSARESGRKGQHTGAQGPALSIELQRQLHLWPNSLNIYHPMGSNRCIMSARK